MVMSRTRVGGPGPSTRDAVVVLGLAGFLALLGPLTLALGDGEGPADPEVPTEVPTGAPTHWAYLAPTPPPIPAPPADGHLGAWAEGAIDTFALAAMLEQGLEPSEDADPATLLRRVSLDLRGLPPTDDEVEAFLADPSPGAYRAWVDEFLASPEYAERQARLWLDLARYADSHGYTVDGPRTMWRYRDWVLDAFREGMPFDQFTIRQLAGDLLPGATLDDQVATGFHRNTMVNQEGGADDEEFRVAAVIDRVDTTASVWMGSTLACARCHDHKFDPFTQRDYFGLYAFFNQTEDRGVHAGPTVEAPTEDQREQLVAYQIRLAELEADRDLARTELDEQGPRILATMEREALEGWDGVASVEAQGDAGMTWSSGDDGVLRASGPVGGSQTSSFTFVPAGSKVAALRIDVLADPERPESGPGMAENGNFVLSEVRVRVLDAEGQGGEPVRPSSALADFHQNRSPSSYWPPERVIDGDPGTGWAILPESGLDHALVLGFDPPLEVQAGGRIALELVQAYGRDHQIGALRIESRVDPVVGATAALPRDLRGVLEGASGDPGVLEGNARWTARLHALLPGVRDAERALEAHRKTKPSVASAMVLRKRMEPRTTHLFERGSFLSPQEVMAPAVPAVLPGLKENEGPATRLDFARWLVSDDNPLTARVTVNRAWMQFFGTGLVRTENDFGLRGEAPTHPELLDHLACEFVAGGWDTRALHRSIVTSRLYRQDSRVEAVRLELDPRNRWLGRQSRLRLDAEVLRDTALEVAGLLHREWGGAPVYPPQPKGLFRFTQSQRTWNASAPPQRYRRTLYTWIWRSLPHPFLTTFDAPEPTSSCTRRNRSNTALQALTLANDPMVLEAARGLGARVLGALEEEGLELGGDRSQRGVDLAFRWALGRDPMDVERERLVTYFEAELEAWSREPTSAREFAEGLPDRFPEEADPAETAAWTSLARVLLNLDEFVTRN